MLRPFQTVTKNQAHGRPLNPLKCADDSTNINKIKEEKKERKMYEKTGKKENLEEQNNKTIFKKY